MKEADSMESTPQTFVPLNNLWKLRKERTFVARESTLWPAPSADAKVHSLECVLECWFLLRYR